MQAVLSRMNFVLSIERVKSDMKRNSNTESFGETKDKNGYKLRIMDSAADNDSGK